MAETPLERYLKNAPEQSVFVLLGTAEKLRKRREELAAAEAKAASKAAEEAELKEQATKRILAKVMNRALLDGFDQFCEGLGVAKCERLKEEENERQQLKEEAEAERKRLEEEERRRQEEAEEKERKEEEGRRLREEQERKRQDEERRWSCVFCVDLFIYAIGVERDCRVKKKPC